MANFLPRAVILSISAFRIAGIIGRSHPTASPSDILKRSPLAVSVNETGQANFYQSCTCGRCDCGRCDCGDKVECTCLHEGVGEHGGVRGCMHLWLYR
jgi:hypothetical protein